MPLITNAVQAKQAGAYDAQNGQGSYAKLSSAPIATGVPSAISVDTLSKTPQLNYVPPTTKQTDAAQNSLDSGMNTLTPPPQVSTQSTQPPQVTTGPSTADTMKQSILDILGVQKTREDFTKQQNDINQVDAKQLAATDAFNKLIQARTSNARKLNSFYEQTGVTKEQAQQQASEFSRIANADEANLAISSQVAQGNFTAASEIAQRAVDAKYAPLKDELSTLGTLYQLNQNDMTESEKMKAQQAFQNKSDQVAFQQKKDLADYQLQIDAKDPSKILDNQYKKAQISRLNAQTNNTRGGTTPSGTPVIAGGGNFTKTQLNIGSSNSGLSIEKFSTLDPNTKNVFINNKTFAKGFNEDLVSYKTNTLSRDELIQKVNDTTILPMEAKTDLINIVNSTTPEAKTGWWDNVKGFFGF